MTALLERFRRNPQADAADQRVQETQAKIGELVEIQKSNLDTTRAISDNVADILRRLETNPFPVTGRRKRAAH